jgi:hypothetical protein
MKLNVMLIPRRFRTYPRPKIETDLGGGLGLPNKAGANGQSTYLGTDRLGFVSHWRISLGP